MTIRRDMCRLVSKASDVLGDSVETVRVFLRWQLALDGGHANKSTTTVSAVPATAAAVAVLQYLRRPVPASPLGGFTAIGKLMIAAATRLTKCLGHDVHNAPPVQGLRQFGAPAKS